MKSKANDASPRNAKASTQTSGQSPSPSVPISVYRQLAAELQATQAMVDSLNAKNQDLTLQNQKLRLEIHRFAQSAIALKSLADSTQLSSHPASSLPVRPSLEETAAASAIAAQLRAADTALAFEEVFTESQELPNLPQEKKPKDLGGLWLTITILLIMVAAFGAGFLVVRPLLPTSSK